MDRIHIHLSFFLSSFSFFFHLLHACVATDDKRSRSPGGEPENKERFFLAGILDSRLDLAVAPPSP